MWTIVVVCAALLVPAQAPPADEACETVCLDASTLQFCDDGVTTELACADVDDGAVCASRTETGSDCLLPPGAVCDDAYAFGASRCVAGFGCIAGRCAVVLASGDVCVLDADNNPITPCANDAACLPAPNAGEGEGEGEGEAQIVSRCQRFIEVDRPTSGTAVDVPAGTATSAFSCLGCSSSSSLTWPLLWLPALVLRYRRRLVR